jgi:hypothetical protein
MVKIIDEIFKFFLFDFKIIIGFSRYLSNPTYSGASKTAIRAKCSPRVTVLAAPMKHESYKYELPLPRPVPPNALKYNATARVSVLADPKKLPGVL